jgi:molybdopterin-containing oxidoreductase family iron-sulfur binding subunit
MTRPEQKRFDIAQARRRLAGCSGKQFWTSLEEIVETGNFREWIEAEFPSAAPILLAEGRRQFLKLMGASLLLAGLGGCGQERADLALPYVNQPEELVPGVPRFYATAVPFEGYVQPVIATTHAGRPTKLDGNPDYPASRGASDAITQATVLQLYDPDRSKAPTRDGAPASWAAFQRELVAMRADWTARHGEGLRLLTGDVTSPTLMRQLDRLHTQLPGTRVHVFEPVGRALRDSAMRLAFGRDVDAHYRLENCEVLVSIDEDVLGAGPHQVAHGRAWAQRRGELSPRQGRMTMHVAESVPSPTGAVASTRFICDASRLAILAQALAAELGIAAAPADATSESERRWVSAAAADLRAHGGRSLLAIGARLAAPVQALAPLVNDRLGNGGSTVWYSDPIGLRPPEGSSLADLAHDITAGAVDTLVAIDCNPVYAAPADLGFAELLPRVRQRIHVGLYRDETARACHWHLPLAHALESWSDGRGVDGSACIMQPVVAPLYSSRTTHQILAMLLGAVDPAPEGLVRETWANTFGDDFDARWRQSLHQGFVADTAAQPVAATPRSVDIPAPSPRDAEAVDIVFCPDPSVWDGRFANVAWLQELPKPLTKLTWDNVIAVSPKMAEQMRLANGDMIEVAVGDRRVSGPAWIMPGQAPNTVALSLGYGRTAAGTIADGIGYSAYAVRADANAWFAAGRLRRVAGNQLLATTQMHHRLEGFDFVREVSADDPSLPQETKPQPSLYAPWPYHGEAWGMAIDLDLCIGCNACISACTAENNVAVVGKEQVAMGREMLWLRVDRYQSGDVDDPHFYFQPVPCMHCEKAPCEMGCPVHATAHSPDGLNQMVYNRCIGTRTCSSYCPYKVRRFNWFDYRAPADSPTHAAHNPDVTVRSRGVMEKCTYCTQRIQAARVAADKENRRIGAGEVVTACQQACPTTAIVFGDLNDPESAVAKRRKSGRHYLLLEELGTRPRTTYLARWNDEPKKEPT